MTRMICDRCGTDVTDKMSAAVRGIANADMQRNGEVTLEADLCRRCYRVLRAWVQTPPIRTRA